MDHIFHSDHRLEAAKHITMHILMNKKCSLNSEVMASKFSVNIRKNVSLLLVAVNESGTDDNIEIGRIITCQ